MLVSKKSLYIYPIKELLKIVKNTCIIIAGIINTQEYSLSSEYLAIVVLINKYGAIIITYEKYIFIDLPFVMVYESFKPFETP